MKKSIKKAPVIRKLFRKFYSLFIEHKTETESRPKPFHGSQEYWETRYVEGGNSGVGSYGIFAEFKAETLNKFVINNNIDSVIEFGCGDGNQLKFSNYPSYLGFDVSENAILNCRKLYASDITKSFNLISDFNNENAALTLSLDVIYHLVEDEIFEDYMFRLFDSSNHFVIIYSSNTDDDTLEGSPHVQHRKFTDWVDKNIDNWKLIEHIPNKHPYKGDYRKGSFSDFYIYNKI